MSTAANASATPGGPDSNYSIDTVNDELYAWLLQNKIEDNQIYKYLSDDVVTLQELSNYSDLDIDELIKNMDVETGSTIKYTRKKRLKDAIKALRQRPYSNNNNGETQSTLFQIPSSYHHHAQFKLINIHNYTLHP